MPAGRTEPTTAVAEWPAWSTTARVVVTEPAALGEARALVEEQLAAVDAAASRFRADAEIVRLAATAGVPTRVSPLLAELVTVALRAAEASGGDVDPTLGGPLAALGYDRDIALIPHDPRDGAPLPAPGAELGAAPRGAAAWRRVVLDSQWLTVPAGVQLDLGATAKAHTADRCATLVAAGLGIGVLVSLGGDLATAGPAPDGGWRVLAQDRPGEPAGAVRLAAGGALATSSTIGRRWRRDGKVLHHILDPRSCRPVEPVWRTVSVAARSCLAANTASTAALVRGVAAVGWLRGLGLPARLVRADGEVVTLAGWPADEPATSFDWRPSPASTGPMPVASPPVAARRGSGGRPLVAPSVPSGGSR
jgi:thiamine biosynthesis lipoprotein